MLNFCFLKIEGKYVKLSFDDILYIEANKNWPKIHLTDRSFIVLVTLKQLEESLPKHLFCRIHRSYIVSIKRITSFDRRFLFIGSKNFPLTRHYKKILAQRVLIIEQQTTSSVSDIPLELQIKSEDLN